MKNTTAQVINCIQVTAFLVKLLEKLQISRARDRIEEHWRQALLNVTDFVMTLSVQVVCDTEDHLVVRELEPFFDCHGIC